MPTDYSYIDRQEELEKLVTRMRGAKRIIIDTEADSFHHYFEKVCLIQLAVDDAFYLVDPLCGLSLDALMAEMAEHRIVLHGADYDLRLLRTGYGFRPHAGIFDTSIAAQLVGIAAFGLSSLVERFCDVKLAKGDTRSDWSVRPLSQTQLRYAVDDVRYLGQVADALQEELVRLGRVEWHAQSCDGQIAATAENRQPDPETEWRVKGSHLLRGIELAFLRELWYWRDREARRIDRPAYMIMGNGPLVVLARAAAEMPANADLPPTFDMPRNIRGGRLEQLISSLARVRKMPSEAYPGPPPALREFWSRALAEKLDLLKKRIADEAVQLSIDPPLIASRGSLAEIVREVPRSIEKLQKVGGLQPWQAELVWPHACVVLDNQATSPN